MVKPKFGVDEEGEESSGGAYFAPSSSLEFISTGCAVLDCVLGGGWPLGRVSNIVGDKSTGKTLLAIEACANFAHTFPKGKIYYREAEAAFDQAYAETLGLPAKRVDFGESFHTVEDMFEDLSRVTEKTGKSVPGLYVVDSLDALSDRDELARDIDKGTYGAAKPKQLSELFRRLTKRVEDSRLHLMVISQVRDNIGATFGRKHTRSGGKALDFYASQILYLAHLGQIKRTINKVERAVGVRIRAKTDKNKVGLPFRECEFAIKFAYGVDDLASNLDWLEGVGRLDALGLTKSELPALIREMEKATRTEFEQVRERVAGAVKQVWVEVEQKFMPKRRKYE